MTVSRDNPRLLAALFESLVRTLYPSGMTPEQKEQAEFMFLGGAHSYMRGSLSAFGPLGMDLRVVPYMQEEIGAFIEEGVARDREAEELLQAASGTAH